MFDVKCSVKSVKGSCSAGYKPGDYFLVKDGLMIEQGNFFGIAFLANLRRLFSRPPAARHRHVTRPMSLPPPVIRATLS